MHTLKKKGEKTVKSNENKFEKIDQNDSQYEGRDQYFIDVDRMINEGLAGGTVITRKEHKQIEEARDLEKE